MQPDPSLARAVRIVTSLSSDVEADVGARDVVDDDRVEALGGELLARALDRARAVLGGEADERLAARRRGEAREHVRGRLELELAGVRARPS